MRLSILYSFWVYLFLLNTTASANTVTHTQSSSNVKMPGLFVFSASKGDVKFNHELHLIALKDEGCIPCHHTQTPKAGDIKTRFDERVAHYFCRGCHRDKGKGPTECHQCHKKK